MAPRIGFGFDTHRLEPGIPFMLGGIRVEHTRGALGHSDADTLIHAICDAMLGAAGLRDIGFYFPDSDPAFRGIDSKVLLHRCLELITAEGFTILNVDATVVLQAPRISDYIPEMIRTLAEILRINENQMSVKAKTSEKLGFIGREEGISAYAVILLEG